MPAVPRKESSCWARPLGWGFGLRPVETCGLLLRAPGGKPEELNLFRDVHGL